MIRDLTLLGKYSDIYLANLWGISRQRVNKLRQERNIPNYNQTYKLNKILEYLKENENIRINKMIIDLDFSFYKNQRISKSVLLEIAQDNNINISIYEKTKYEHGCESYKNKCSCNICKLANTLRQRLFRKYKKSNNDFCNYIANTYLEFYLTDKSQYSQIFYSFVDQEFKCLNQQKDLKLETDGN